MFTLKFFILFLLAALCFADTSASGAADEPSPNGDADSENGTPSAANDAGESKLAAAREKSKNFKEAVGLPSWIDDPTTFMDTLIKRCHDPLPTWETIRNETINWEKCTFTCKHNSNEHEQKLPENTPCGIDKKCQNGTCLQQPTIPAALPSCR
uniref:Putative secreted salivary protein n=1 Tax=Ixodes scapularis TaxID=6945 RepID=Q4PN87_IXOSC|nr:putative secreted salivary protein [Ixodes scapularis]